MKGKRIESRSENVYVCYCPVSQQPQLKKNTNTKKVNGSIEPKGMTIVMRCPFHPYVLYLRQLSKKRREIFQAVRTHSSSLTPGPNTFLSQYLLLLLWLQILYFISFSLLLSPFNSTFRNQTQYFISNNIEEPFNKHPESIEGGVRGGWQSHASFIRRLISDEFFFF